MNSNNQDIRKASWYHGRIDRMTTEAVLGGKRAGLFLVRDSSTCPGDYVLSVSENSRVSHYIITRRGGQYVIGDQTFEDIPQVIEFYRRHFLDTTTLTEIAPRVVVDQGGPQSMPAPSSAVMSSGPPVGGTPDVVGTLRVRGKFDFKSDDPEDLYFKKGDIMVVLRKDEEEWWFVKHSDGRTGSIPVPYIEVIQDANKPFKAKALMDRQCPYDPTALPFKKGDIISVTKQNDNGLWEGQTIDGRKGHFPFTLVEPIDRH
ncbi:crk-like protein [Dysidea avara]|uniref:crk-like protein n=1 Tax=Dysidea avara TaxID=196820 RepID=UPI00331F95A7